MVESTRRLHIGAVALLSASTVYLIPLLIFGYPPSLAVAGAVAVLMGIGAYRKQRGKEAFPDRLAAVVAVLALLVYAAALIGGAVPGDAGEWVAMLIVFAIPIILLAQLYRGRHERGGGARGT